jgi:hypothetical protein
MESEQPLLGCEGGRGMTHLTECVIWGRREPCRSRSWRSGCVWVCVGVWCSVKRLKGQKSWRWDRASCSAIAVQQDGRRQERIID